MRALCMVKIPSFQASPSAASPGDRPAPAPVLQDLLPWSLVGVTLLMAGAVLRQEQAHPGSLSVRGHTALQSWHVLVLSTETGACRVDFLDPSLPLSLSQCPHLHKETHKVSLNEPQCQHCPQEAFTAQSPYFPLLRCSWGKNQPLHTSICLWSMGNSMEEIWVRCCSWRASCREQVM